MSTNKPNTHNSVYVTALAQTCKKWGFMCSAEPNLKGDFLPKFSVFPPILEFCMYKSQITNHNHIDYHITNL